MEFEGFEDLNDITIEDNTNNGNLSNNNEDSDDLSLKAISEKYDELGIPNKATQNAKALTKCDKEIFEQRLFFIIADKIKNNPKEKEKLSQFFEFLESHKSAILKDDIENIIKEEKESKDDLIDFWIKKLSFIILKNKLKKNIDIIKEDDYFSYIKDLIFLLILIMI